MKTQYNMLLDTNVIKELKGLKASLEKETFNELMLLAVDLLKKEEAKQ